MDTEQLYRTQIICGCFRSLLPWLLLAIMKKCAERCALQLYGTSLNEETNHEPIFPTSLRNISLWSKIQSKSSNLIEETGEGIRLITQPAFTRSGVLIVNFEQFHILFWCFCC